MQRHYVITKGPSSQGYGFSSSRVWMWELDCKKAECWRIDAFELVLEKTLESLLDFKEVKPINPKGNRSEYSLEGLMLKLKLQYFGHLMWRTDSLEKTLMLVKIESKRRRWWQRMRWLDGITNSLNGWVWAGYRSWWQTGKPGVMQSMGSQRVKHD